MSLVINSTVKNVAICSYKDDECKVYIKPYEIHTLTSLKEIDQFIQRKVALQVQQSCTKHGYVLSGFSSKHTNNGSNRELHKPLQITTRSMGEIPHEHLNGAYLYRVCYRVFVCNPPIGSVLPCNCTRQKQVRHTLLLLSISLTMLKIIQYQLVM